MRREGHLINHRRTERLYQEEGLCLQLKRRKNVVATLGLYCHRQSGLTSFRRYRALTLVDNLSKECPILEVVHSLTRQRVVQVLERISLTRELPEVITVDNGPEFIRKLSMLGRTRTTLN